jgi:hypothetical protein
MINILFYKFFRFFEKYSHGDRDHSAFSAMVFTNLILFLNILTLFFMVKRIFPFQLNKLELIIVALIHLSIVFGFCYFHFMRKSNYERIIKKVSHSEMKGIKGNIIATSYALLSLTILFCLILFFLKNPIESSN